MIIFFFLLSGGLVIFALTECKLACCIFRLKRAKAASFSLFLVEAIKIRIEINWDEKLREGIMAISIRLCYFHWSWNDYNRQFAVAREREREKKWLLLSSSNVNCSAKLKMIMSVRSFVSLFSACFFLVQDKIIILKLSWKCSLHIG